MLSFFGAEVEAGERTLQCVDAGDISEFFEERDPRSCFLTLLSSETTGIVAEIGAHLAQHEWERATESWLCGLVAPVHEEVLLARMTVHVAKHH